MGTAGRYLGSAVLTVALGLSPALGYATTFVLLGLAAISWLWQGPLARRFAATSPPEGGVSPRLGVGAFPALLFGLSYLLIAVSALTTVRTPADLVPLLGLAAPLFYAPLASLVGGADLVRYGIAGAIIGLATALLYRYGLGMPRAAEGSWLTDPYRLAVTTLLAATLGLGAWFSQHRWRGLSLFALAAGVAVIVLSGSRTALLGLPVLMLITGLCLARRPLARIAVIAAAVAVIVAALFVELPGTERVRLWDILVAIGSGSPVSDSAIDIRLGLYRAAAELFVSSPLLGHGWGEATMPQVWALLTPAQLSWGRLPHLHSDIAQFAVSGGLFGIMAWLLLVLAPIAGYLRLPDNARTPQRRHALLVLVVGALVLGLPDTFLAAPMTLTIYVVLAAAVVGRSPRP
ncbi:MAG: O-antigen ligase family protein [Devosia sp.]|uniref:O-antigen ligase family protein n=1 Tax=Devosia sp. TaxID=1871048 RepID=UPI001AC4627B|nr:O-antigen ligase family protein [Devosia sp.]MBN9317596.1 O-antigen ligase family protein [Devosia sp.]